MRLLTSLCALMLVSCASRPASPPSVLDSVSSAVAHWSQLAHQDCGNAGDSREFCEKMKAGAAEQLRALEVPEAEP